MKQWADSPLAKWEDITGGNLTTMENPIYMMIVDDPSSGQIVSAKQTVMIVAGISIFSNVLIVLVNIRVATHITGLALLGKAGRSLEYM